MKKRTKEEKAVENISQIILKAFGPELGTIIKSYDIDPIGINTFLILSKQLREHRKMIEIDFKIFCKKNKIQQYKVKDIEEGSVQKLDKEIFKKYITIISAEKIVKSWIGKFPRIAKKYEIKV